MAHLTDLKWARPIRPIQTVDKKGRDADYSLNSLLLLPSAGSPFIFLFHGGHRLTLLYSTASITNNPTLPLSLLVLIFLFHSKPFANPSPIAPPTIPLCQIHPPHHSNEHGGWRGRHGHQARHDELLRAGGKGGAGHRSGVPRRQHRDAGEDRGHRRLQCGAGGVQEGEGPEADEARDGAFGEGRYDSDEAFAGVSVGVGGWGKLGREIVLCPVGRVVLLMFGGPPPVFMDQSGIKRHNFRRGPMTHGSKSHRALGSIGAGTTPGHVYKGKKMPGRMGGTKTKIRKLKIVKIDNDLRVVMIKGAVPASLELNFVFMILYCSFGDQREMNGKRVALLVEPFLMTVQFPCKGRYVVGNLLQFSWGECMTPGSVRETLQSNGRLE
ncbi:50S ribosomal protein L3, chloroplastic [Vitis vinifera]|uniref:Large ribosomal subunit protein uL3c n=1 Tax=Vitis vinifera TaxID=29760 RepID=A0A438GYB3_VITVI|nr:50S ribosomal protein L3, chloroplastic [Vitis vinifera]